LDEGLNALRILLVDDQEVDLLFVRRTLERAGYTQVQSTTDSSRVAALFEKTSPDLVVLDLHMPGIDGLQLIAELAGVAGGRTGVPFWC
jgi:putative two-component system response regulator